MDSNKVWPLAVEVAARVTDHFGDPTDQAGCIMLALGMIFGRYDNADKTEADFLTMIDEGKEVALHAYRVGIKIAAQLQRDMPKRIN